VTGGQHDWSSVEVLVGGHRLAVSGVSYSDMQAAEVCVDGRPVVTGGTYSTTARWTYPAGTLRWVRSRPTRAELNRAKATRRARRGQ